MEEGSVVSAWPALELVEEWCLMFHDKTRPKVLLFTLSFP